MKRDVRLATLEQAQKDGTIEEGEVDEGDRVCFSLQGRKHGVCQC